MNQFSSSCMALSPQKKKSCFLCCFGFSNQQKYKQKSFFSFKRFQRKQSPVKTNPVDITVKGGAEKLNTSREIHVVKSTATTVYMPQVPVTGQTIHFNKARQQDIILEKSKRLEHLSCQKGLFKSFTIATSDNFVIGSPEDKQNKQPVLATNKIDDEKDTFNFDSFIGMLILMVTLIIMLFWGKFCAIVCMSAWFYFLPIFRAKNEALIAKQNGGNLDLNSKEYKKVVLHGFLERHHRNVVGF